MGSLLARIYIHDLNFEVQGTISKPTDDTKLLIVTNSEENSSTSQIFIGGGDIYKHIRCEWPVHVL